jgi:hypothetical protein
VIVAINNVYIFYIRSPVLFSYSFVISLSLSTGKPVILKSVELIYQRRKVHSVFATDSFSFRIPGKTNQILLIFPVQGKQKW